MIGGRVYVRTEECSPEADLKSAFVLSYRDQLLRSSFANAFAHRLHPVGEALLREHFIVVNSQRVVAGVHSTRIEIYVFGQRNYSLDRSDWHIPGHGLISPIRISVIQA